MATPKIRLVKTSSKSNKLNKSIINNYRRASVGLHLSSGRYVAPGARVMTQSAANSLSTVRSQPIYKASKARLLAQSSVRNSLKPVKVGNAA